MKAALLEAVGRPLTVGQAPTPRVGPDEVLIETRTCGICRTDVHIQDGLAYIPQLPHIPGHEPAGVVSEVGERVVDVKPGDRVVPYLFMKCGCCRNCQTGRDAQCVNVRGILGVTAHGGFAEYFKAPAANLLVLPPEVPFDVGGLTSCAIVTAVHAFRRSGLSLGDCAVVVGVGGIGQILVQILKHAGVRVAALNRSHEGARLAEAAGADLSLQFTPDAPARIVDFAGGYGVTCAFECVGLAATMKTSADCIQRGGRIVVIGEEAEHPAIDTIQIAQRELEIIGSRNGARQDAADAIAWISQGVIRPTIAKRLPLEQINDGLQIVRDGAAHGRVVVVVREDE